MAKRRLLGKPRTVKERQRDRCFVSPRSNPLLFPPWVGKNEAKGLQGVRLQILNNFVSPIFSGLDVQTS